MEHLTDLQTERLSLREPSENDFDAYAEFYSDGEASHFYGGPIKAHTAWNRLARDIGHWRIRGYGQWTLVQKNGGEEIVREAFPDGLDRSVYRLPQFV